MVRATWKCDFLSSSKDKWKGKKVNGHLYVKSHVAGHLTPCCLLTLELIQTRQTCLVVSYFDTMGLPLV